MLINKKAKKNSEIYFFSKVIAGIYLHALTEELVLVVECYDWLTSDFSEKSSLPVQIWVYKQKFSNFYFKTSFLKFLCSLVFITGGLSNLLSTADLDFISKCIHLSLNKACAPSESQSSGPTKSPKQFLTYQFSCISFTYLFSCSLLTVSIPLTLLM